MAQNLQTDAFYLDADADNCPSDGFPHSLLKGHVGYQYQKYGCLGYSQCSSLPGRQNVLAEHQINKIQGTVAQYLLLIEHRDTATGHLVAKKRHWRLYKNAKIAKPIFISWY